MSLCDRIDLGFDKAVVICRTHCVDKDKRARRRIFRERDLEESAVLGICEVQPFDISGEQRRNHGRRQLREHCFETWRGDAGCCKNLTRFFTAGISNVTVPRVVRVAGQSHKVLTGQQVQNRLALGGVAVPGIKVIRQLIGDQSSFFGGQFLTKRLLLKNFQE